MIVEDPAPDEAGHDEAGLDLARSTARSLASGPAKSQRGRRPRRVDPKATGAHPDDRDPQTLDSTLARLVGQQGWGSDLRVHGVFARWEALVGREVAQHVKPVSFAPGETAETGGRLTVRTDSTAWATQMKLLSANVVRRLNEVLGDGTVAVIDIEGPNLPNWKKGRLSTRDGRGPRDTYG